MSGQIFEGATVEEALQKAAAELGVEVADLEHEAAGDQGGDFWGLGEPAVSVRAWVRVADEAEAPPAPEELEGPGADTGPATEPNSFFAPAPAVDPAREPAVAPELEPQLAAEPVARTAEAEEATVEATVSTQDPPEPIVESAAAGEEPAPGNLEEATVALLNRIFGTMGFDCSAEARVDGDALLVAISGDDNQYLLDGRGRGLSALELILNHAFRHRAGDEHRKIHVDAGDFRARREDEIRDLAYQVSHQAKETGTEQETQPLNPYERRIVHLTLADDEQVTTRSRGAGFMKSVSIIPTTRGPR